ncbi:hypothetical protein [Streptomyces sp. SID12501]|uniref:hypothetical protein n=1 Tax=Streptomyces sp. SID12501 TaxID=2706042 RepID=UPI001943CB02|nr:hypothetical protein [Streptomyces sp. SID12501]
MPDKPAGEFWKDLRPIENSFRPDALPEVYLSEVATDDDRCDVPFPETAGRARTAGVDIGRPRPAPPRRSA